MILARLRQVGTWFWLGLACAAGLAVAIWWAWRYRGKVFMPLEARAFEDVLDATELRVQLANARAAVTIAAARTKDAMVKAELRAVVQSDRSEADKLRAMVALKERLGRS